MTNEPIGGPNMQTVPSDDPLQSLPSPHQIRQRLSLALGESDVLKRLLKVAEHRVKLSGDTQQDQPAERKGAADE
jgi:hypothetical protein